MTRNECVAAVREKFAAALVSADSDDLLRLHTAVALGELVMSLRRHIGEQEEFVRGLDVAAGRSATLPINHIAQSDALPDPNGRDEWFVSVSRAAIVPEQHCGVLN